jgi:hypothetical protein
LLEKYDNKLDEMQEDIEVKELKIYEYEKNIENSEDKIKFESVEEKIKFLVKMLHHLREIHNDKSKL